MKVTRQQYESFQVHGRPIFNCHEYRNWLMKKFRTIQQRVIESWEKELKTKQEAKKDTTF